jgi:hypothetical protein
MNARRNQYSLRFPGRVVPSVPDARPHETPAGELEANQCTLGISHSLDNHKEKCPDGGR